MSQMMKKVEKMMRKLKETDYEGFDSKDDALDFIERRLATFPKYANVVITQQVMLPIWRERYEGQEYRDRVMDIDSRRRNIHESAISACTVLNRLSNKLGLETFADIDTSDRHQVAEFVGRAVNEMYNDGIGNDGNAFDAATHGRRKEYDEKLMREELEKLDRNYAAINHSGPGSMEIEV